MNRPHIVSVPLAWHIAYGVLFTQTNPAVRPRTLRSLEQDMLQQGIPLLARR